MMILLSERLRDIIYDDENSCYYIYAETHRKFNVEISSMNILYDYTIFLHQNLSSRYFL